MLYLVTGAAGFIGMHTCRTLLERGDEVIGVDVLNHYYDPALKSARLKILQQYPAFTFQRADIAVAAEIEELAKQYPGVTHIIHLAAQAGVRYSVSHPYEYIHSNIEGQMVMLEFARHLKNCEHFVYASSSSVYGSNEKLPFSVEDRVDHPVSLYAATKRAGELMADCYSHLYKIPSTGLRFFTVYGPWGRPDMAAFLFVDAIVKGKPIKVFNYGDMHRSFTYIDDIVGGVLAVTAKPPAAPGPLAKLYNIGNDSSEALTRYISVIEEALGIKATILLEPMQQGDVKNTYADIEPLRRDFNYNPSTSIDVGLPKFVEWYREYYGV
jgi:UDP-glucuronate 4-epimerase